VHSVSEAITLIMSQDYRFSQDAESQLAANEGKLCCASPEGPAVVLHTIPDS